MRRRITGHGVLVDSDAEEVTNLLDFATSELERPEIPEDEVVVCAIGLELVTMLGEL